MDIDLKTLRVIPGDFILDLTTGIITDQDQFKSIIYAIQNSVTRMYYIGQTKCYKKKNGIPTWTDPIERFHQHLKRAVHPKTMNDCAKFYAAIREYPTNVWSFQVLEKCPKSEINIRERYYIKLYHSKRMGYNISRGGQRAPKKGSKKKSWKAKK
jgi:hypothetical protein